MVSLSICDTSIFLVVLFPLKYVLMPYLPHMPLMVSQRPCTYGITMYPLNVSLVLVFLVCFVENSCNPSHPWPIMGIQTWWGPSLCSYSKYFWSGWNCFSPMCNYTVLGPCMVIVVPVQILAGMGECFHNPTLNRNTGWHNLLHLWDRVLVNIPELQINHWQEHPLHQHVHRTPLVPPRISRSYISTYINNFPQNWRS